jgi:hypothetical protein
MYWLELPLKKARISIENSCLQPKLNYSFIGRPKKQQLGSEALMNFNLGRPGLDVQIL